MTYITQLNTPPNKKREFLFIYEQTKRIENCLYTRFEGVRRYLQLAHYKIQVFAYENNINLKGDNYTIFIKNKNSDVICDYLWRLKLNNIYNFVKFRDGYIMYHKKVRNFCCG